MNCTICNSEIKQIPAGVSNRTGQPYNAFMACPNKCKQGTQPVPQPITQPTPKEQFANKMDEQKEQAKWNKIAEGKVRHGFAVEAYKMGKTLDQDTIIEINKWVSYVVTGQLWGITEQDKEDFINESS